MDTYLKEEYNKFIKLLAIILIGVLFLFSGVHKIFNKFSQKNLKNKIISQFFHFVNFDEKNREFLMTKYLY